MSPLPIAVALDFDGVISDSAPEAFVVAQETYRELRPASGLDAPGREAAPAAALYAAFVEWMPLGNRAEDFAVSLDALAEGIAVLDQDEYDAYRSRFDPGFLADFHTRFYEVRHAFAARDPEAWRNCMRPYPAIVDALRLSSGKPKMVIATAKDRLSVRRLLHDYGLDGHFPDDRIFDKEVGVRKRAHLERIREKFGCAFEQLRFVDDKLNHLEDVASLGVECVLASWGYNGPREEAGARAAGFEVATLADAEALLFSPRFRAAARP